MPWDFRQTVPEDEDRIFDPNYLGTRSSSRNPAAAGPSTRLVRIWDSHKNNDRIATLKVRTKKNEHGSLGLALKDSNGRALVTGDRPRAGVCVNPGVKVNDVITEVDGEKCESFADCCAKIRDAGHSTNGVVMLTVWRTIPTDDIGGHLFRSAFGGSVREEVEKYQAAEAAAVAEREAAAVAARRTARANREAAEAAAARVAEAEREAVAAAAAAAQARRARERMRRQTTPFTASMAATNTSVGSDSTAATADDGRGRREEFLLQKVEGLEARVRTLESHMATIGSLEERIGALERMGAY